MFFWEGGRGCFKFLHEEREVIERQNKIGIKLQPKKNTFFFLLFAYSLRLSI